MNLRQDNVTADHEHELVCPLVLQPRFKYKYSVFVGFGVNVLQPIQMAHHASIFQVELKVAVCRLVPKFSHDVESVAKITVYQFSFVGRFDFSIEISEAMFQEIVFRELALVFSKRGDLKDLLQS